jgi:hypothetical protein
MKTANQQFWGLSIFFDTDVSRSSKQLRLPWDRGDQFRIPSTYAQVSQRFVRRREVEANGLFLSRVKTRFTIGEAVSVIQGKSLDDYVDRRPRGFVLEGDCSVFALALDERGTFWSRMAHLDTRRTVPLDWRLRRGQERRSYSDLSQLKSMQKAETGFWTRGGVGHARVWEERDSYGSPPPGRRRKAILRV